MNHSAGLQLDGAELHNTQVQMNDRYIPCDQESYVYVGQVKFGKPLFYMK